MSICSKHRIKDPNCPACNTVLDFPRPQYDLITCSKCNFVYYQNCDTCPKCQIENI